MTPNHTNSALFVILSLGWVMHPVSPASGQVCDGVWRQVALENMYRPLGLLEHAMYYDMDRHVTVLHGGYYGGSSDSTTVAWTWDTNEWQSTTPGPQAAEHALGYDSSRRLAVLFGGVTVDEGVEFPMEGTWLCDIVACSRAPVLAPEPPWRRNAAMVYDSGRDRVVLFGGADVDSLDSSPFGDTWEWDGSRWELRSSEGPAPRYGHAMAYDAARGVTVLFGGVRWTGNGLQHFNDTWEWNGSQWLWRSKTGPHPRSDHAMVYDPVPGAVLLFGGKNLYYTCLYFSDLWQWNDGYWRLRTLSGPSARAYHAMTYDTDRNVVMLFGGYDINYPPANSELWEYTSGECAPNDRPLGEYYPACSGAPYAAKNRYLSVVPPPVPNGATGIALRVTFGPMPGPSDCPKVPDFSAFNGVQMWVGPEVLQGGTVPTGVYELQSTPLFRDWTTVPAGVLQISDCNIVPCATYTFESISDMDYPAGPYSPPLVLSTTATWGDIVDHSYGPGEGMCDVIDVVAMVDRIKSMAGAPPGTWCDLYANRPSQGVNLNIDALDIVLAVDALKGSNYPFTGPAAPGACPGAP